MFFGNGNQLIIVSSKHLLKFSCDEKGMRDEGQEARKKFLFENFSVNVSKPLYKENLNIFSREIPIGKISCK